MNRLCRLEEGSRPSGHWSQSGAWPHPWQALVKRSHKSHKTAANNKPATKEKLSFSEVSTKPPEFLLLLHITPGIGRSPSGLPQNLQVLARAGPPTTASSSAITHEGFRSNQNIPVCRGSPACVWPPVAEAHTTVVIGD